MEIPPLHDLVIKTIAEYLLKNNDAQVKLQCVSKRFYGLRDNFIRQLFLNTKKVDMHTMINHTVGTKFMR